MYVWWVFEQNNIVYDVKLLTVGEETRNLAEVSSTYVTQVNVNGAAW